MIAAVKPNNFAALWRAIGHPEYATDSRFGTGKGRAENGAAMMAMLDEWAVDKTAAECEAILTEGDVPCSRYLTMRETLAQPHLAERGSFEVIDDGAGPLKVPNPAFKFARSTAKARNYVPALGRRQRECTFRRFGLFKGSHRSALRTANSSRRRRHAKMGEILAVGITHYPPLAGRDETMAFILKRMLENPHLPEKWRQSRKTGPKRCARSGAPTRAPRRREFIANDCVHALRKTRAQIDEFRPDFIVVWGDDQYENFREDVVPPYCIYAHESFEFGPGPMPNNIWNEPAGPKVSPARQCRRRESILPAA